MYSLLGSSPNGEGAEIIENFQFRILAVFSVKYITIAISSMEKEYIII